MNGFFLFFFKLSLVVVGMFLVGKLWPEEFRKFPFRGGIFFYIPAIVNGNWKFTLFMAALITVNIFLTVLIGKRWSEGKRAVLFFLLLFVELVFLTFLAVYFKHYRASRLPLRTFSSPASP